MSEYISAIGLPPLLNRMGTNLVGAEIGVCEATSTRYILDNCPGCIVHGIDPWQPYSDVLSPSVQLEEQEKNYKTAVERLSLPKYEGRIFIHKMTSKEAANLIQDRSLDFVFIDGSHNYENVLEDLTLWYPKLKLTGLLSGHDIGVPTVAQAMREFGIENGLQYFPIENSAWYAKKTIQVTKL